MSSLRQRLSQCDIEAIFDSVKQNELPPSHLGVKVIRVPMKNAKISPPPFAYDEGIYILLHNKNCLASVPSTLSDLVMTERELADLNTCHWRSSGLKSHSANVDSAKYFVRYCYPHGENDYVDNKSASVWTMRERDDNEIFNIRILHIYRTEKRRPGSRLSSNRPRKKNSLIVKVSHEQDDIDGLMNCDLITTPTRNYKDVHRVALSSPESLDPECLFDLNNDSDQFIFPDRPLYSAAPSPVRISLSPSKGSAVTTFGRKIDELSREVLQSNKQDQTTMLEMLKQQLEVLSSTIYHDGNESPTVVKSANHMIKDKKCGDSSYLW